jgi:uncharacterized membrane protein
MAVYLVVRVLHVLLGAFWAGAVFFSMLLLDPAIREAGPEGGKVMGILQRRGWMTMMISAGSLTIVTGFYLFWRMSGRFAPAYMGTPGGIMLSIGMLAGILVLAVGVTFSRPTGKRIGELAGRIASAGGPPSAEDAADLARLQGRLALLLKVVATLMLVAVVTMALGPHI